MRRFGLAAGAVAAGAVAVRSASCADGPFARARVVDTVDVAATRWVKLQTLTYTDPTGRTRKWDRATRTTRLSSHGPDGVAILALLRHRNEPYEKAEVLLITQFRPPVDAVTVELPAGLVDPGEAVEVAALRELKEETGYVGSVVNVSGALGMSPGLCDESACLCVVEVDLDAPANAVPKQELEDSEFIKVHRVALKALLPTIQDMERAGIVPFAGLYTLAVGLSLGLRGGSAALIGPSTNPPAT